MHALRSARLRIRRLTVLVGTAVAIAMVLAGCASPSDEDSGSAVLRIGIQVDFAGLNPATGRADRPIRPLMYEPLVQVAADGEMVPGLATEWRSSEENRVWEFGLRPDVKFSDGSALTADVIKDWFEYFAATKGPFVARMGEVRSVEVVDELTVRIELAEPNPIVPNVLAINNWGSVASPEAIADPAILDTESRGAGPYRLDTSRTVSGDTYVLVPNEHYYDPEKIEFDEIEVKVIGSPTSMLQAIQAGQLDVAIGHPSTASAAEKAGLNVIAVPGYVQAFLFTDASGTQSPALGDLRVRQALNYAIDREAVATALAGEYGAATSEVASTDGWVPEYQDYFAYDPGRAQELLDEAGYGDGFTLRILETSDKSNLTQAVASYLSEVGVELDVTTASSNSDYVRLLQEQTFEIVGQELPGDGSAWYLHLGALAKGSLFNYTGWTDPELEGIVSEGAVAEDGTAQWEAFSRHVTENALFFPIYRQDAIYYVSKSVDGVSWTDRAGFPLVMDWTRAG